MTKKRATIHDIARKLNVTASTVSRALQDHPRISEETRKAVLEAARKLNYQHNSIAAALRKGKSNLIGVMVPASDRYFFGTVIRGIEEVVNQSGYRVIIAQSNDSTDREKANIDALLEAQVDGILASVAQNTLYFDHYHKIEERGIPLIFFDRVTDLLGGGSVVIDDYEGAYKAVEHLIEQGCRRIVHFGGQQNLVIYRERLRGYRQALAAHGLPVRDELILCSDTQLRAGVQLAQKILSMPVLPDAIFSASDYTAVGAMHHLKRNGIRIPEQIAIAGFSNEVFTALVDPPLTTIDQHGKMMGRVAAEIFLKQVDSPDSICEPDRMVLNPDLIIRKSSLKMKKREND